MVTALLDGFCSSFAFAAFVDGYFASLDFIHVVYDYCNKERNKVAHELARLAKFSKTRDWCEEPIDNILSFLIDDVTLISN